MYWKPFLIYPLTRIPRRQVTVSFTYYYFLSIVKSLIMCSGYGGPTKGIEGDLADKWFSAQKTLFVTAGKSFGDKVKMQTSCS